MFQDIAIGVKTFLRDEKLYKTVDGIINNLPSAQIIIADDGYETEPKHNLYTELSRAGHIIQMCPFDSGFGYKSNEIVKHLERPYLLVASDDFLFTLETAHGVRRLQDVLDNGPNIQIASGRVNNRPYEFYLGIKDGVVIETPVTILPNILFQMADLTVNYSLIHYSVFDKVSWDNDVKIGGGEHGAFFYDVKQAGYRVAFVPGVNINEQKEPDSRLYKSYRSRAIMKSRPCFEKRGIKKYILGTGEVDYDSDKCKVM